MKLRFSRNLKNGGEKRDGDLVWCSANSLNIAYLREADSCCKNLAVED
jgi:hypothetical protein